MTEQVSVHAIPGIDLAFRPPTYFGPIPAETHLLAHINGYERREFVRAQLTSNGDNHTLDLLTGLFGLDRESLGRIHPGLMGGEYLPPFLENETEIARISLASTTADQISVRAQPVPDGIGYRIVDEYGDQDPPYCTYVCDPDRSDHALTLAELVALIDNALPNGGAALSHLRAVVAVGAEDPSTLRHFVQVSSEFYPQLASYYDQRIEAWFAENVPAINDEDDK